MSGWISLGDDVWVRADLIEMVQPAPDTPGRWGGKPRARVHAAGKTVIGAEGMTVGKVMDRIALLDARKEE